MVKRVKNIFYWELGSWARCCGIWLQVVEAAAKLVPERLEWWLFSTGVAWVSLKKNKNKNTSNNKE